MKWMVSSLIAYNVMGKWHTPEKNQMERMRRYL
jgi:hypothetical protein